MIYLKSVQSPYQVLFLLFPPLDHLRFLDAVHVLWPYLSTMLPFPLLYTSLLCCILLLSAPYSSILLYTALLCFILLFSIVYWYIMLQTAILFFILLYYALYWSTLSYDPIICPILLYSAINSWNVLYCTLLYTGTICCIQMTSALYCCAML